MGISALILQTQPFLSMCNLGWQCCPGTGQWDDQKFLMSPKEITLKIA